MLSDHEAGSPCFGARIKRMISNSLELLHNRIELVGVELQEEKNRLIEVLIWASASIFLTGLAFIVITITLVLVAWEDQEHRLIALCGLSMLYLLLALCSLARLRCKLRQASHPFHETLCALKRDRQCLEEPAM